MQVPKFIPANTCNDRSLVNLTTISGKPLVYSDRSTNANDQRCATALGQAVGNRVCATCISRGACEDAAYYVGPGHYLDGSSVRDVQYFVSPKSSRASFYSERIASPRRFETRFGLVSTLVTYSCCCFMESGPSSSQV